MHNTDENRDDEIVELLEQILEKLSSIDTKTKYILENTYDIESNTRNL